MTFPESKSSGIEIIAEFRRIPSGFPTQGFNRQIIETRKSWMSHLPLIVIPPAKIRCHAKKLSENNMSTRSSNDARGGSFAWLNSSISKGFELREVLMTAVSLSLWQKYMNSLQIQSSSVTKHRMEWPARMWFRWWCSWQVTQNNCARIIMTGWFVPWNCHSWRVLVEFRLHRQQQLSVHASKSNSSSAGITPLSVCEKSISNLTSLLTNFSPCNHTSSWDLMQHVWWGAMEISALLAQQKLRNTRRLRKTTVSLLLLFALALHQARLGHGSSFWRGKRN